MTHFLPPAFYSPGPLEIGIVLVVVLIVFGPGKLPDVFKALGSGMRQFKEAANPELFNVNTAHHPPLSSEPSTPVESKDAKQEEPVVVGTDVK